MSKYPALKQLKQQLIDLVSAALIKEPSFEGLADAWSGRGLNASNPITRMASLVHQISAEDPQFVLKLIVYLRDDLGIRATSNFLTALCAYEPNVLPYLSCYLPYIVLLPSDWLQVATFARDLPSRITVGLPTALRRALLDTFRKFNEYSLAKYNKESAQKAKAKRQQQPSAPKSSSDDDSDGNNSSSDGEAEKPKMPYTLKQMIRMLHIGHPAYYVMSILGKRYPRNLEEFARSGLAEEGHTFEEARAGTRMRLSIPTTWETQLAARGNTASVWEELVSTRNLPFMAMLRNLRNIILAGCSEETHSQIMHRLTSEDQVAGSRQFPYRFFSAFDAVDIDLANAYLPEGGVEPAKKEKTDGRPVKLRARPEKPPTQELLGQYRRALDRSVQLATKHNVRPIHGRTIVFCAVHANMVDAVSGGAKGIGSVRSYMDLAVLMGLMFKYACEDCEFYLFNGSGYAEVGSAIKDGAILQNMKSVMSLAASVPATGPRHCSNAHQLVHESAKVRCGSCSRKDHCWSCSICGTAQCSDCSSRFVKDCFPFSILDRIVDERQPIDAVVILDDKHSTYPADRTIRGDLPTYLRKLRWYCNDSLLYVAVNVKGATAVEMNPGAAFTHPNDALLTGFSDAVLRFVAERGAGGPCRYIEKIDTVKGIDVSSALQRRVDTTRAAKKPPASPDIEGAESGKEEEDPFAEVEEPDEQPLVPTPFRLPATNLQNGELRFFISSTFLDMQNERSALVQEVFPAVRRMALEAGIRCTLVEVDLRWGITTEDVAHGLTLSYCLNEVARCAPCIISLVGDRCGYCPSKPYSVVPDPDVSPNHYDWTETCPEGKSITQLEFLQSMASSDVAEFPHGMGKLFFLRNNHELEASLPDTYLSRFKSESAAAARSIHEFRGELRNLGSTSGAKALSYTARYLHAGSREEGPALDMSEFVRKATAALWECVEALAPKENELSEPLGPEDTPEDDLEEWAQATFERSSHRTFAGQKEFIESVTDTVQKGGSDGTQRLFLLTADEGCGKSAVMAALADVFRETSTPASNSLILTHYFGAGNRLAATALRRLAISLTKSLCLEEEFDLAMLRDSDGDHLADVLPDIYATAAKRKKVIVLLDGLDSCTTPEMLMRYLPVLIPSPPEPNSCFVVSVRAANSAFLAALRARRPPPTHFAVPDLSVEDRGAVLRKHLKYIGKRFQESASYGNQLRPLIRKAESGKPGYLVQVVTALRLFSTFDTLNRDIRNMPASTGQLQAQMIERLEALFGGEVCRKVLTSLVLSEALGGMHEPMVYRYCGTHDTRRVLTLLGDCVTWGQGVIKLRSAALLRAVRKTYLFSTSVEVAAHKALCDFYLSGPGDQSKTQVPDPSLVAALPPRSLLATLHHALKAKRFPVIEIIATSFDCLDAIIRGRLLSPLLDLIAELEAIHRPTYRILEPFSIFLLAHRHILSQHPNLVLQCARNMPRGTPIYAAAVKTPTRIPWVGWMNRADHGDKDCTQTSNHLTSQPILSVTFDEHGDRIALGGKDWTARVFNVLNGTVGIQVKHPHDVTAVAFLPRHLVTGSEDGKMRLWSLVDGALVLIGKGHSRRINDIAVNTAKGAVILTASDDCTAKIFTPGAHPNSHEIPAAYTYRKHFAPVSACAYHSGGVIKATGSWDSRVLFYGLDRERFVAFHTNGGAVRSIAFIPSMVVTAAIACFDGKIRLFDYASEQCTVILDRHLGVPITRVSFASDGKKMLSTDIGGYVRVWRAGVVGTLLGSLNGHHKAVHSGAWHPTAPNVLVSASSDASLRHWETKIEVEGEPGHLGAIHNSAVTCTAFAPDGSFIVSASRDGTVHCTSLREDPPRVTFSMRPQNPHPITALLVVVCPDESSRIVSGDTQGNIYVWRSTTGLGGNDGSLCVQGTVPDLKKNEPAAPVILLFEWNSPKIAGATSAGNFILMDVLTGEVERETIVLGNLKTEITCQFAGSTPGRASMGTMEAAIGVIEQTTQVRRKATVGNYQANILPDHTRKQNQTELSPWITAGAVFQSTSFVAAATSFRELLVFSQNRKALAKRSLRSTANAIIFLDPSRVAVACEDGSIEVLFLSTDREEKLHLDSKHLFFGTAPIRALCFFAGAKGDLLCGGDALGNLYFLTLQQPELDSRILLPTSAEEMRSLSEQWMSSDIPGSMEVRGLPPPTTEESMVFSAVADMFTSGSFPGLVEDASAGEPQLKKSPAIPTDYPPRVEMEKIYAELNVYSGLIQQPPKSIRGAKLQEWHLQQRALFFRALRDSRHNAAARLALRIYSARVMATAGLFAALN